MIIWTAGTPHCPPLQLLHLCLLSLPLSLCHLGWLIIAFQKQSTPLLPPPPPSTVSTSSTSSSSAPFSTDSITQSAYRTIKGPSLREGQWPRLLRTHTAAYRQLFKQQCLTHTHTHTHTPASASAASWWWRRLVTRAPLEKKTSQAKRWSILSVLWPLSYSYMFMLPPPRRSVSSPRMHLHHPSVSYLWPSQAC